MTKKNNIHDLTFKDLASDRNFVIATIKQLLPFEISSRLDKKSVELVKVNTEHTRDQQRDNVKQKEISDLVYFFKTVDQDEVLFFLHCENHVSPDRNLIFNCKKYQHEILADYIKMNKKNVKLPLVFSVVFYGNKKPYPYSTDIYDAFQNPELARKFAFQVYFADISAHSDAELKKFEPPLALYSLAFKHNIRRTVDEYFDSIIALLAEEYDLRRVQVIIKYLCHYSSMQQSEFFDKIIFHQSDLEGNTMTVAEQLQQQGLQKGLQKGLQQGVQQGMQQGLQQGVQQGIEQGMIKSAINMLKEGLSVDATVRCSGLSIQKIKQLKRNLKQKRSIMEE